MKALSIRQPWAFFILEGEPLKDYENRDWTEEYARAQLNRCSVGSDFLIHASKRMTAKEYDDAIKFAATHCGAVRLPAFASLKRGGIVGGARLVAVVRKSTSPWFTGPLALRLEKPYTLPFKPLAGQLGFFEAGELYG
jgi:hypothetical protein